MAGNDFLHPAVPMKPFAVFCAVLLLVGPACSSKSEPKSESSWLGVYSSPSEIEGFSGTVLAIGKALVGDHIDYRMTFHSDLVSSDAIEETEKHGSIQTDGDKLYIPKASGYYLDGKPCLLASIERYTRVEINGRTVLLRDDALKAFREQDRLYDYGMLIKVSDEINRFAALEDVKHESIKVLYKDPSKEWKDPFVSGPNQR